MLRLSNRRTTQPRDFAAIRPELALGLQMCSSGPCFESHFALAAKNLGHGPPLLLENSGSPPGTREHIGSRYGPLIGRGSPAGTQLYKPYSTEINALLAATGQVTCMALVRAAATDGGGNKGPIKLGNGGSFEHYPYSDNLIYMGPFAGDRWINGVASPVDVFTPHCSVITHRSGEQTYHIGGKLLSTDTRAETPAIGIGDGDWNIGQNGAVYLFAIWNRVLPRKLAARLSANPWYLFAPRSIWVPVAAGATFNVAWAANANTLIQPGVVNA